MIPVRSGSRIPPKKRIIHIRPIAAIKLSTNGIQTAKLNPIVVRQRQSGIAYFDWKLPIIPRMGWLARAPLMGLVSDVSANKIVTFAFGTNNTSTK